MLYVFCITDQWSPLWCCARVNCGPTSGERSIEMATMSVPKITSTSSNTSESTYQQKQWKFNYNLGYLKPEIFLEFLLQNWRHYYISYLVCILLSRETMVCTGVCQHGLKKLICVFCFHISWSGLSYLSAMYLCGRNWSGFVSIVNLKLLHVVNWVTYAAVNNRPCVDTQGERSWPSG